MVRYDMTQLLPYHTTRSNTIRYNYTLLSVLTDIRMKILHLDNKVHVWELQKPIVVSVLKRWDSCVGCFFTTFTAVIQLCSCSVSRLQVSFPAPLWKRSPFPARSLETDCMCASMITAQQSRATCHWREVQTHWTHSYRPFTSNDWSMNHSLSLWLFKTRRLLSAHTLAS